MSTSTELTREKIKETVENFFEKFVENESEKLLGKTVWFIFEDKEYEYYSDDNSGKMNRKNKTRFIIKKAWLSKNNIWKMQEYWKDNKLFFSLEEAECKLKELIGGNELLLQEKTKKCVQLGL